MCTADVEMFMES